MRKKRALNEFEFVEKKENGKTQEELGKGAFGRVRLAIDKLTDTKVAIKTIPKKILKENASAEHLKREIKLHRKLDHPHIVKLYHSLEDDANVYLVLEYVPMGNLFVYLRKSKTLEEQEAFVYFLQTALAIDYLHKKGIIHRDLKPENILLDAQGNIKICDFGWSAELQPERRTFCGTLDYMCPEMMNSQNHDHRVDIWAMGILLFEMLHGFAPYNKNRASQEVVIKAIMNAGSTKLPFNDKISNDAKNLIQSILKVNPLERLSMEEIFSHQWVKKHALALGINIPEFVYEKGVNETVQSINDISINIENLTHSNAKPKSNYISQKLPDPQYNPQNYQSQQLPVQYIEPNYNSKPSNTSSQQPNKPTFDALFQSTSQQQSVTPPRVPQPQHSSSRSPIKLTPEQQKQKEQLLGTNQIDQDQRSNYQMQQYQEKQDLNASKNSSLHQSGLSPNTQQLMQRQDASPNSRKPIFDDKMAKSQMIINKYTSQPNQQNMFLSQEFNKSPNKSDEFKKYQEKEQERKQKEEEFRKQQLLELQRREEEYKREEQRQKEERQRQEQLELQKKQQDMENQRKIKEFEEEQRRQREQEKIRKQKEYEDMLQKQKQQELEKQKRDQELEQIRKEKEEQERIRREQQLLEEKERIRQEQLLEQRRREEQQAQFRREQEEKQKREQERWEREQKERLRKEREEQERQKKLQDELLQKQYEQKKQEQLNKSNNQDSKYYQNTELEQSKKMQQLEQKARQEYQQYLINQSSASCNSQATTSKQKRQISDDDLFVENQNSYIPPKQKKQQNDEEYELEQKLHVMLVQNLDLDIHPQLQTKIVKPDEQSKLDWDISVIEQQKQTEIDQFEALQQNPPIQKASQQRSVSPNTRQTRFTPRATKMEDRPTHINNMLDDQLDEWDLSEDPQIKLLNQLLEQPQRQKKEKKKIFEEVTHSAVQETQSQTQQTQSTNKFSFGEHKVRQQPETVEKLEESFRKDRSMRMNTSRDRSRNKIQPAKSTQQHKQPVQQPVEENSEEEQLENLKRSKSSNQDNTYDQKLQQFKKYDCDPYSSGYQNQTTDQYKPRKSRISERQNRTIPSRPLQEMDFFDRLKFAFGCLSRRQ